MRLQSLRDPAEIRGCTIDELKVLADEIRQTILETVAINGGHLASSLGSVELAVALHHVFQTPADRLVWDVGHQGYPHKLLTGRFDRFPTLRQNDGLSGFLRRSESEYDVFGAGHAGTSISAAVGLALARDLQGLSHKVVAVIGDGSMTCGLPFEALNNAGHLGASMLVVLNDNEMSISENVGALSKYFNWLVQSRFYNETKKEAHNIVKHAPLGDKVIKMIHRWEESTKGLILPSLFFEDLGFRYLGPVDGHDLDALVPTLQRIRELDGPILLHAITQKGRGYKQAEGDAIFWHSPPNFKVETGEYKKSSSVTYTHVYGDYLLELAASNPQVVAITAAMATGTGLVKFSEQFPSRFIDVGIAEAHAVTSAAGMAIDGIRPFVTIYSTFLQRAYDSIVHDVALQNLPVVFAMDRAGLVGLDGPTHHGLYDVAYLRSIPNMTVMAPRDEDELRDMMLTAAGHTSGPIAFRYPRATVSGTAPLREPRVLEIGRAEIVCEGDGRVALISYGHIFGNVLKAADLLREAGVEPAIVNARFAKPLDAQMICGAAKRYSVLVTIEEAAALGGFGSAVNEALAAMRSGVQAEIIGVPDVFIEHGDQGRQQEQCGLSPKWIADRVLHLLEALPAGAAGVAPAALRAVPARTGSAA